MTEQFVRINCKLYNVRYIKEFECDETMCVMTTAATGFNPPKSFLRSSLNNCPDELLFDLTKHLKQQQSNKEI